MRPPSGDAVVDAFDKILADHPEGEGRGGLPTAGTINAYIGQLVRDPGPSSGSNPAYAERVPPGQSPWGPGRHQLTQRGRTIS